MSEQAENPPAPRWRRLLRRIILVLVVVDLIGVAAMLVFGEMRTSWLQAHFLSRMAGELSYPLAPGKGDILRAPNGPYDERLGYSRLPAIAERLAGRDFAVAEAARPSARMRQLDDFGLFPPYHEKDRAGLKLFDDTGKRLYETDYPERIYDRFAEIPPLLVDSLLYIENKELLDPEHPRRNPAVEWDRFAKAVLDQLLLFVGSDHGAPGGSTLATQIEKYRHSAEGRTNSRKDKLRQMASASIRAYLDGPDTLENRRRIARAYLNTVPLSAKPGFGEVNGLGDGLFVWYGRDFAEVNKLLRRNAGTAPSAMAGVYKEALSLMIAQRRPSYYLGNGNRDLDEMTNQYLRLLARDGVISGELRDAALAFRLRLDSGYRPPAQPSFVERKASTALRTHLMDLLGMTRFYDIDRLDLSARSTLDADAQRAVTDVLRDLKDPDKARAAGLDGFRMLGSADDVGKIIYSFTLYERGRGANLLRVQADNYDQPFDINEGVRLDLGSTAKLRTLVTYLEIFCELHRRYGNLSVEELKHLPPTRDVLTRWTIDYLIHAEDRGLHALLEAAVERRYSANPHETFFTGGGAHTFVNFDKQEDGQQYTVRDGLRHSVNLVYIRIMRDVAHYYMHENPAADPAMIENPDDPRRAYYLARFADREGRTFIGGFYRKYRGKTSDEALAMLLQAARKSPHSVAVVLRSIMPSLPEAGFAYAMRQQLGDAGGLDDDTLRSLYERYGPDKFNLPDRGYLARVHPLELWLVGYLRTHPGASLREVMEASVGQRQEVYTWLFKTRHKNAQDVRIKSLLEVEAFLAIGHSWQRLGYPFDNLTPSYASAIGSSGDRPAALAKLMGLIVNKGISYPAARFEELHFAAHTPYEMRFVRRPAVGERLLPEELTDVVREALIGVVEDGTARRLRGAFQKPDGSVIPAGGKTGTGDHRLEVFGRGGRLISERVISRSATFVFLIGDRFFGTITAYVGQPHAEHYVFTSALAVQLLRALAPSLMPMIEKADARPPETPAAADASPAPAVSPVAVLPAAGEPGRTEVVTPLTIRPEGGESGKAGPVGAAPEAAEPDAGAPDWRTLRWQDMVPAAPAGK